MCLMTEPKDRRTRKARLLEEAKKLRRQAEKQAFLGLDSTRLYHKAAEKERQARYA